MPPEKNYSKENIENERKRRNFRTWIDSIELDPKIEKKKENGKNLCLLKLLAFVNGHRVLRIRLVR